MPSDPGAGWHWPGLRGPTSGLDPRSVPAHCPQSVRAVEGKRAPEVLPTLRGHPNVLRLHSTNGRWDSAAELRADSLEAFDRVLGQIRLIDGIANTETSILLSTHKL